MVVKKSVQCGECMKYVDVYIKEDERMVGVEILCKCGNRQKCISENKHIAKWRKI